MDGEKRSAPRKHLHYPARIASSDGSGDLMPCVLTDISESGVRISLQAEGDLPDTVTLFLSPRGVKRECRVAWREGTEVGMEFIKPEPEARRRS